MGSATTQRFVVVLANRRIFFHPHSRAACPDGHSVLLCLGSASDQPHDSLFLRHVVNQSRLARFRTERGAMVDKMRLGRKQKDESVNALNLFGWNDAGIFDFGRRAKADQAGRRASHEEEVGPRGLIVRDPFASQILDGDKVWEIRGRPTQIRGPVVIVKSGTGRVFGTVNLVRVLGPLELDDLVHAPELPILEREEIRRNGLPYLSTYAYVFSNPKWFERPIPYRHPSGAVTWVRLPDLDLEAVRYAASRLGGSQPCLV